MTLTCNSPQFFISIDATSWGQTSVQEGVERRSPSIEDRTGESCLFQTILMVVLLEYCCRENISFNYFIGLPIRKALIIQGVLRCPDRISVASGDLVVLCLLRELSKDQNSLVGRVFSAEPHVRF